MSARHINAMATWMESTAKLSWSKKDAQRSATIAYSDAIAMGIDQDMAGQTVLELTATTFLSKAALIRYFNWPKSSDELPPIS